MNLNEINDDYIPVLYKLSDPTTTDILKNKIEPSLSTNISYPKFSLGFFHHIHQSRGKLTEIENQFVGKKQVYNLLNKFNNQVDDFDDSIEKVSTKYFDITSVNKKPKILSNAFYSMWEIVMMFDIIQVDSSKFVSAHLNDGVGSFAQAIIQFRDTFTTKNTSKNDKYHVINYEQKIDSSFVKYYQKDKPVRLEVDEIKSTKMSRQVKKSKKKSKKKKDVQSGGKVDNIMADLVTSNGSYNLELNLTEEQDSSKIILTQIIQAVKIQAKSGSYVCKIYESFTDVTIKLIAILKSLYKDVIIYKPLISNLSSSEKYLVCTNFKFSKDSKEKSSIITKLESVLKLYNTSKLNITNIFPAFDIQYEKTFNDIIIAMNSEISNRQFMIINNMVTFVDNQNYRGDVYQTYREQQINANAFWITHFLPSGKTIKELNSSKKKLSKFTEDIITRNSSKIKKLTKLLVY